jgi:hypothetical protein
MPPPRVAVLPLMVPPVIVTLARVAVAALSDVPGAFTKMAPPSVAAFPVNCPPSITNSAVLLFVAPNTDTKGEVLEE